MTNGVFTHSTKYLLKDSVNYSDGSVVSKIITRNSAGNVTLFAFDDGQNLSEHTAPFDAIIQILDGKANVLINNISHILEKDDMIIMPANVPHAIEAEGKFKMLLTMIKA